MKERQISKTENSTEKNPDNGHNEINWDEFKERYSVPTIGEINGRLQVYRRALKRYFEKEDESCLDVVDPDFLEKHRRVADKVLLGVRQETKKTKG